MAVLPEALVQILLQSAPFGLLVVDSVSWTPASKPKGADCSKICTSASGKTAIPVLKNCKHYCNCTKAGRGDKVKTADDKIWSASKGKEVSAPGDASDCPGRPQVDLSGIEKEAAQQVIQEIETQGDVDPDLKDLEETIVKDLATDLIELKVKEQDDDEDSPEETRNAIEKKIADDIVKEALKKLPGPVDDAKKEEVKRLIIGESEKENNIGVKDGDERNLQSLGGRKLFLGGLFKAIGPILKVVGPLAIKFAPIALNALSGILGGGGDGGGEA
jgi:hypothetical protein